MALWLLSNQPGHGTGVWGGFGFVASDLDGNLDSGMFGACGSNGLS